MSLADHRLATRIPVAFEAVLEMPDEFATPIRLHNLSRHGAYAHAMLPVPLCQWVRLYIQVPGSPVRCLLSATVVRSNAGWVGLKFDDYGVENATLLGQLLSLDYDSAAAASATQRRILAAAKSRLRLLLRPFDHLFVTRKSGRRPGGT